MRRAALVVLAGILAVALSNHSSVSSELAGGDEAAVLVTETEIATAFDHNDANALDRLWAPGYSFVNPAGIVMTKEQRLEMLRTGHLKVESYSYDQFSTQIYGSTAIVIARSTVQGQRGALDISSQRRVMTVLMKNNGRWQAVAQQSTRIEQLPPGGSGQK